MSKRATFVIILAGLWLAHLGVAADIPGTVAWWELDDGAGTTALDSSGNDHHGEIFGGPAWVEGVYGGALEFDGSDDRVEMPSTSPSQGFPATDSEVTWALWFKTGSGAGARTLMALGPAGAAHVRGNRSVNVEGSGVIMVRAHSVGALTSINSIGTVNDNEWHHVAVTIAFETGGANDSMRVYIDGDLGIGYQTDSVNINQHQGDASDFIMTLGARGGFYDGLIDDVAVFARALSADEVLAVMAGRSNELASGPIPNNDGTDVARDSMLSWQAGEFAVTHDVYLGTSMDAVAAASAADAQGTVSAQGLTEPAFDPGRLDLGQTYYWRVDEVNGAPDFTLYKGEVWNFTVEPVGLPITDITVTASSSFGLSVPENTINGSGLVDDLHGVSAVDMWISGGIPATIEYAFDQAYKLHEMWVWNSNQTIETFLGFGAKDVTIETSLDGENWSVLEGVAPLAQGTGAAGYAANSIIDLSGVTAQHVRMTVNSVHGFAPQASLSEVRFLYIPTFATGPNPASGATDVAPDLILSWHRDGREADTHDIYLGLAADNLSLAGSVPESSFETLTSDLQLGQTYYWQVVEVNNAEDPSQWAGDIWSFTTVPSVMIDDMEGYADAEFQEIWATWTDGFDDPDNGALVGNGVAGTPETTLIYGGDQSLPLHYDNGAAAMSETTRTFDTAMDWSKHGVKSLVLFFQGASANTGGQLYIKVNDTKIAYHGAASDLIGLGWNKWSIPVSEMGAEAGRVTSLTIGVEGGGTGVVYIDEIQLTTTDRELIMPTQPSDEALVAHYAFDGDTSDSTGNNPGTLFGNGVYVPGAIGQALNLVDPVIASYVAIDGLFYETSDIAEVSVAAWIRTQEAGNQIISSFDRNEYWRLEINGNGGGPGQVGWDVWTSTGQLDYGSTTRVDDGEWHLVVGVFDKGTSTIYIDGHAERSASGGSLLGTGNLRYGFIGTGSEATAFDGAQTTNYFIGDLDDVRIYHRALSAAEIAGMAGRTEPFEKP